MSVLKNLNLHRKLLLIVGWAALSMALLIALSLYNRWQQTAGRTQNPGAQPGRGR
jgi:hypothetical protein